MKPLLSCFTRFISTVVAAVLLCMAGSAQAALVSFSGNLTAHNDVAHIAFTLNEDMNDFRLWTDSFRDGINFDPAVALWRADNGNLVAWNDDEYIDPGQTDGDAGIFLKLEAGDYILTLIASSNFALGNNLADGFSFDDFPLIPLDTGTYWRVWMTSAQAAGVPEPALLALLLMGALGAGIARTGRTRQKQTSCSV